MFVRSDIDNLLRTHDVRIWYSFLPTSGSYEYVGEQPVDPNTANNVMAHFATQYFGDRLKLTLGPIVKSHGSVDDKKRGKFKQFDHCYDLRATGNRIELMPREVISIQTNERIALSANIAATVLPRLTHADSGLLYVPSYIDPYWDGLLQGVIVNLTNEKQVLHIGENIAICRFYKVSSPAPEESKDAFPAKSHHFALNWPRILDEGQDADPFPVRKRPLSSERSSWLMQIWRAIVKHAKLVLSVGALTAIVGVIFAAGKIYPKISALLEFDTKQTDFKQKLDAVLEVQKHRPLTGVHNLQLTAKQSVATARIILSRYMSDKSACWVAPVGRQSGINSLASSIEQGNGSDPSVLFLSITVTPDQRERVIPLQWMVVE